MKAKTSSTFEKLKLSPIVTISERAKETAPKYEQLTGKTFVYFQRGEVGFDTPEYIIQAITEAATKKKLTKYPKSGGEIWLKDAVIKHTHEIGIEGITQENILCTQGGQEGLELVFKLFEGRKVAGFSPIWPGMIEAILPYTNCEAILLPLEEKDKQLKINISKLEKILQEVELFYLNSPHNPTGKVFTKEEIETINHLCKKNDVLLVSDEAYKDILFDEKKHTSLLEYAGNHIISVFTGSKTFAITGLRVGYTVSRNKELIKLLTKGQQTQCAGVAPIIQYALAKALEEKHEKDKWIEKFVGELEQRRNMIFNGIKDFFGEKVYKPEGAFYFFLNLNKYLPAKVQDKDKYVLDKMMENGIAVVNGTAFGKEHEGYIRLAFSTLTQTAIKEGIERLKETIQKF